LKKILTIIILTSFIFCMFFGKKTLALETPSYTDITMSANNFKSYMNYRAIRNKTSAQYKLQQLCTTDLDGFRRCANRYVIAVGSGVGGQVGDCVDLILENGQVICCVIGDYKGDKHTDAINLTGKNGCCAEFIVDTFVLKRDIKLKGNIGLAYPGWESPVATLRRYDINCLGGMKK